MHTSGGPEGLHLQSIECCKNRNKRSDTINVPRRPLVAIFVYTLVGAFVGPAPWHTIGSQVKTLMDHDNGEPSDLTLLLQGKWQSDNVIIGERANRGYVHIRFHHRTKRGMIRPLVAQTQ